MTTLAKKRKRSIRANELKESDSGKPKSTYVREIMCLPQSWCDSGRHITIPRGDKRRLLTDNGLLGMIEFHSNMKEPEIIRLVTETFATPVGLTSSDVSNGKTFKFVFLQRAGAGSKALCVPSLSDNFQWNAKNIATLAKCGGTIYIKALETLFVDVS